ncbi:hypothetical protein [Streptomyces bullii]|uniref:Uncharacterized protein n=1 Tax=Streptomyces bullii TaxID=349910 RepID=A0ABW0USD5_9ACTN
MDPTPNDWQRTSRPPLAVAWLAYGSAADELRTAAGDAPSRATGDTSGEDR